MLIQEPVKTTGLFQSARSSRECPEYDSDSEKYQCNSFESKSEHIHLRKENYVACI
jgi:hypothetical protein